MKKGFSLFELLVSISIIGILVAIVSISYSSAQKKARDSRRISDLNMIQKAAEMYYGLNSYKYPDNGGDYAVNQVWTVDGQTVLESYPADPKQGGTIVIGADTYTFNYGIANPSENTYCVWVPMENSGAGNCGAGCDFVNPDKDFYCVKNQQ